MDTVLNTITSKKHQQDKQTDIIALYNEASEDYTFWSKDYNMHFGYFSLFKTNVLRRDSMLNEMNRQVIKRLKLPHRKPILADMGCGMGGTMRFALSKFKELSAIGITLSKFQVVEGNTLLAKNRGILLQQDFRHTTLASSSIDGAIAIESYCHAGHSKSAFREAHRILKKSGKLVIADAFLKKEPAELRTTSHFCYRKLCNHWGLEKLKAIHSAKKDLKEVGFSNVRVEDISFRVAPSVLHVPFAIVGFAIKNMLKGKVLKKESVHNLKGSFYALLSGLHLNSFRYYLISCTK